MLPEGTNDGEIASIRLRAKKLAREAAEAQSLRKEKSGRERGKRPGSQDGQALRNGGRSIRGFFDNMSHEWTVKFVGHRVADRRVLRLIRKWLRAGVSEEGNAQASQEDTGDSRHSSRLLLRVWFRRLVQTRRLRFVAGVRRGWCCAGWRNYLRHSEDFGSSSRSDLPVSLGIRMVVF